MYKLALAAALMVAPAAAQAEDWFFVGMNEGFTAAVFVDKDSIAKGAQHPQARMLIVLGRDANSIAALEATTAFDCAGKKRQGQNAIGYAAGGETLRSDTTVDVWHEVGTGTFYEGALQFVCAGGVLQGTQSFGAGLPVAKAREVMGRARDEAARAQEGQNRPAQPAQPTLPQGD